MNDESEIEYLKSEIDDLEQQISSLNYEVRSLERDNNELQERVDEMENEDTKDSDYVRLRDLIEQYICDTLGTAEVPLVTENHLINHLIKSIHNE